MGTAMRQHKPQFATTAHFLLKELMRSMAMPAEFHDIAKRVNNWGRWGADDEIGTLNLITDEVVRAAAAEIRTGRRIPLALPSRRTGCSPA